MRPFLACDWGTTNVRSWRVNADGIAEHYSTFKFGAGTLTSGEAPVRFMEIQTAMDAGGWPALLCGMIGSDLGWRTAPYCACPAGIDDLARHLLPVSDDVWIVPGLRCAGAFGTSDVMRGEETQIAGWLNADTARLHGRHIVCHPGTHTKWVIVEHGKVVRFYTSMTGELFALLSANSSLRSGDEDTDEGFAAGLSAAGAGDALAMRLFSARARVVGDGANPETTRSYLSGLLIGSECAAAQTLLGFTDQPVHLIGDADLVKHYQNALQQRGALATRCDGEDAALSGLKIIWKCFHDSR